MGVRFALPAPSVTVAEWLRRWIVAPTTRVQFSPVTPFEGGGSVGGKPPVFEAGRGVRFGAPLHLGPASGRWRGAPWARQRI